MKLFNLESDPMIEPSRREHPIDKEIRLIVADAVSSGETLRMGMHVKRLEAAYGATGLSKARIENELILAAAHAGVPLEMNRAE